MRSLVVGQLRTLAEVTYAVENARGTIAGSVGRVDNAFDALDLLDGEPMMLFLEVSGPGDPQIGQVRTLIMRGARVVILAKEPSPELRIGAVKAGAREVLFPPWSPARVQARMIGAGGTGFVRGGTPVDFRAILLPEETKAQVDARVTSLHPAGLVADVGYSKIFCDAILRVAIQAPPPHRLPVLIARAVADALQKSVALQFVGLTEEDETLLQQVIASVSSSKTAESGPLPQEINDGSTRIAVTKLGEANPAEARNAIGRVIADIDASVLRAAPSKWLGLTLPVLTDAERAAMVKGDPLADVAVWRTRAHVIASILEASPELATSELPFDEWRQGLADARGLVRADISQRMTEGDAVLLRETRDVQARLNAVSDRIDRLAREAGVEIASDSGPLESPQSGPATFERPAPPPAPSARTASPAPSASTGPSRLRIAFLSFLVVAAVAGLIAARQATQSRRSVDIGRTGVAQRPIREVAGVRVRSVFREPNRRVVVVDRTWYDRGYDASPRTRGDAARLLALELGLEKPVVIRDYAGRKVADTDDGLDVAPLSAGSAASPATTAGPPEPAVTPDSPAPAQPRPSPPAKKRPPVPASPSR